MRRFAVQDLYNEYHANACVMFASIPNFAEFWSLADVQRKLECLRLLNEIIVSFDRVSATSGNEM